MKYKKILLLCSLLVLSGCFDKGASTSDKIIAKVGKKVFYDTDIAKKVSSLDPQLKNYFSKKENKVKLLDQIIDEEVIYQLAKKEGFKRNTEFKSMLKELQRQTLINFYIKKKVDEGSNVTKEEVEKFYKENINQFSEYKTRSLSHILVEKKDDALKIKRLMKKGRAFEELAKKYSIDPSKDNGGKLGWIRKEQLVPEFSNEAFKLTKKAPVSEIVKTQFGYHVIKFHDERTMPARELNSVYGSISEQLLNQKKRTLFQELLTSGKESFKVERSVDNI